MASPQFPISIKDLNAATQLIRKYNDACFEQNKLPIIMRRIACVATAIFATYFLLMPAISLPLMLFSIGALGAYALFKQSQVKSNMLEVTREMRKMFLEKVTSILSYLAMLHYSGALASRLPSLFTRSGDGDGRY